MSDEFWNVGETIPMPEVVKTPSNHYVDKAKLNDALRNWKTNREHAIANNLEAPVMPEYAANSIIEIARNASLKWNFRGYSFREDMVGDAILNVMKYIQNYDPDAYTKSGLPNPFWYISRMCINTFRFKIGTEEKQQYFKMATVGSMADDLISDEDFTAGLPNGTTSAREMFQDMQSKARSFEEKQLIKKARKKQEIEEAAALLGIDVSEMGEEQEFSISKIFM